VVVFEEAKTRWGGKMIQKKEFANVQYQCIEACGDTIMLAGGRFPFAGGQSNYSAEIRCVDAETFETRWIHTQAKNHPYRKIVTCGWIVAAMIAQNFPRATTGVWLFDSRTGELIASHQVDGIVDIASNGGEIFTLARSLQQHSAPVVKLFPHESMICELPSQEHDTPTMLAAFDDALLVGFEVDSNDDLLYRLECRSRSDHSVTWCSTSHHDGVQACKDFLYRYTFANRSRSIEVLEKSTGKCFREIPIKSKGVSSITELGNEALGWVDDNVRLGIWTMRSEQTRYIQHNVAVPGWLALSYSADTKCVYVVHAENHLGMKSKLYCLHLERTIP